MHSRFAPWADRFVAVQSVVRDRDNRLWVLDTGNPLLTGVLNDAPRQFVFHGDTTLVQRSLGLGAKRKARGAKRATPKYLFIP